MKYQAQVKFDIEAPDGEEYSRQHLTTGAREFIQDMLGDPEGGIIVSNVQVDLSEYPARAGSMGDKYQSEDYDAQFPPGPSGLLPPMDVTHPWDQGAWIFPDDHPLAAAERSAKGYHDLRAPQKGPEWSAGFKQALLDAGSIEGEVVDE